MSDTTAQLRDAVARMMRQQQRRWGGDARGVWLSVALLLVVLTHVWRLLRSRIDVHSVRKQLPAPARDVDESAHTSPTTTSTPTDATDAAKATRRAHKTVKLAEAAVVVCSDKDNDDNDDNDDDDERNAAGKAGTSVRIRSPHRDGSGNSRGSKRATRRHTHRHHGTQHKSSSSSSSSVSRHASELNSALPTIMLVVGIHGSGKTEWATQYVQRVHRSYELISSDALRRAMTGVANDYSREDEVAAQLLREVARVVAARHSCIVDDCVHNLSPSFRARVLQLVPRDKYNCAMKLLPIKTLFAQTRIDKDVHEGKERYVPTPLQLDDELEQYERTETAAKDEGWVLVS